MENTLGKRIIAHRKQLGLTQDKLAEMMGVTPQAVSKWENDQSCPDITALPQLADIFGITTDELLGHTTKAITYTEVVQEDTENNKASGHSFEFKYENGKLDTLFLALFVLLVGALTFVSRFLSWDVSFWSILWPCAVLMFGLRGLFYKFSFFKAGCVFVGGYFLADNLHLIMWEISGNLIFPILILVFGAALFVDALKKPRRSQIKIQNAKSSKKFKNHFSTEGETFLCTLSFGETMHQVILPRLSYGEISCSFGELAIDLCGCEDFADNCSIRANCSFGELNLLIPKNVRLEHDGSTAFAGIDIQGTPDPDAKAVIHLDAQVSFGEIVVRYI